ncbi:5290_t:CDS:2 [Acaulospora morrowiae]|uniref:Magnesium-transporting ATPase, P-type 1 n=1 Tax=Acaulospora morrowiae TaxID=94023 RepID=A0A9N8VUA1_9GLOM|nr:5290_t:CDS:2 [Acaulospora morrowiae]
MTSPLRYPDEDATATSSSMVETVVQIDSEPHKYDLDHIQGFDSVHPSDELRPLSRELAEQRLAKFGPNIITAYQPLRWYKILYNSVLHPFNLILGCFAIFSGATLDFNTMTFLIVMILMSVLIRFSQEYKNERAAQGLKSMVSNKVTVIRLYGPPDDRDPNFEDLKKMDRGEVVEVEIPLEEVVPGDWVKLSAGDLIPGDLQLLSSKDLFVSQASLTGEAIPVEKFVIQQRPPISIVVDNLDEKQKPKAAELDQPDFCFMGTSVVSGTAIGCVLETGSSTFFGIMAKSLAGRRPANAFQQGIKKVSYFFIIVVFCMLPPVLLLQGFLNHDWWNGFLFAAAVGIGLTPEMLPMIVNANLARGAISLAKKKCIVKNLDSVIALGGMDILCTDKTGTLTRNKVTLIKHVNHLGTPCPFPLRLSYLNSYFQTGLKNLMDVAVIEYFESDESHVNDEVTKGFLKVDEIPFDFVRRRMSVILETDWDPDYRFLISKGAVDEMLDCCENIFLGKDSDVDSSIDCPDGFFPTSNIVQLTPEILKSIKDLNENLNNDGLRVIAVAYKRMKERVEPFTVAHETGLTLVGFCAFLDPPKPSAKPALQELFKYNISVKVLTGDSPTVCRKVCQEIDLPVKAVVTTTDLNDINDTQMEEIAENATIFAKLTPLQKAQIVRALKRRGHIVGFLGDGINDAPAIRESDCGISVDEGTDIAKESADIILLEKNLMVLADGVIGGRITFGNTIKYIKMAISSNFGNVFSILISSAWLSFLPMLPIQVIAQNFLYDISQIAIPWDKLDPEFLLEPKRWNPKSIARFMICIGPWSSIFDISTFLFMWYYYNCKEETPYHQSLFPSPIVLFGTITVMIIGIAVPFTPVRHLLDMVNLPGLYFAYLVSALLGYWIFTSIAKKIYIYLFKEWL